jgi:hypothetical protein
MLTDASLRHLLGEGYETSDADFVAHPVEKVSRAVYYMAGFLRESRYRSRHKYISSVDLQRQIDDQLRTSGHMPTDKKFNPVDWFSEQWTLAVEGKPTHPSFLNEYRELFDRSRQSKRRVDRSQGRVSGLRVGCSPSGRCAFLDAMHR